VLAFTDTRGAVEVVFTDRHGGAGASGGTASGGTAAEVGALDLAEPPLDAPDRESRLEVLQRNVDLLRQAVAGDGAPAPRVLRVRQVHGATVHVADRVWLDRQDDAAGPPGDLPEADGLVTDVPGTALLLRVADCVPVLLADPDRGVVGAAHAGRLGLVAGVVPETVRRMRDLGAQEIVAWLGPHICGRCYEVPEPMRREVAEIVPEASTETSWGTPAVDVGAGVLAQLRAEGVEVVDASRCTREDEQLWSYRRDGDAAGRLGALVWVRP